MMWRPALPCTPVGEKRTTTADSFTPGMGVGTRLRPLSHTHRELRERVRGHARRAKTSDPSCVDVCIRTVLFCVGFLFCDEQTICLNVICVRRRFPHCRACCSVCHQHYIWALDSTHQRFFSPLPFAASVKHTHSNENAKWVGRKPKKGAYAVSSAIAAVHCASSRQREINRGCGREGRGGEGGGGHIGSKGCQT